MWWRLYWKPNLVFIVCVCLPSFSRSTGQDENRHCEKSCIHWFLCFYEHFCCRFVWVGPEKRGDCGVLKIFRSTNFNQNLCQMRWLSIRDTKRDISRATQYDPLFSPSEEIQPVHCLHCICGHREVCTARMTAWLPFVVVSRQSSSKKLLVVCRPIVGL